MLTVLEQTLQKGLCSLRRLVILIHQVDDLRHTRSS